MNYSKLCLNLIFFAYLSGAIVTADIIKRCRIGDDACAFQSAKVALPQILAGIPAMGVPSSDPLPVDLIDGNLSILKYKMTEATIVGFKDCDINKFKLNVNQMTVKIAMICPKIYMEGNYVINGRLIVLPVEGNGTYTIDTNKYRAELDLELKKTKGKDGKDHLTIKSFKSTVEPLESIIFVFNNLFNGNKALSDVIHKFANENWKEVANLVQTPVFDTAFKKIVNNVNKYLKIVPYDNLFI